MDDAERLQAAMGLLEGLYLADFRPEEFHDEYELITDGWRRS